MVSEEPLMRKSMVLWMMFAAVAGTGTGRARGADDFDGAVRPLIGQYCVSCHGADKPSGGLNLERFLKQPAEAAKEPSAWGLVLEKLAAREMPPAGRPQPSDKEVAAAIGW